MEASLKKKSAMNRRILKIAHRGYSERYPENTMPAFRAAMEAGAHMIELDIHMAKDGSLVVIHDETIDRTSNGAGMVKEMTLQELKAYDFGYWKGPETAPIPSLEEVMDLCGDRTGLNIEIKNCPGNYEGIEKELVGLMKKKGLRESVIVSSFDHYSLARIKEIDRSVRTGMLYDALWTTFRDEVKALDPYSLHPGIDVAFSGELRWAHERGLMIYPWVARDRATVERLMGTGWVDGIMVNDLTLLE